VTVRLPAPGPIAGATTRPAGFAHPHASEEAGPDRRGRPDPARPGRLGLHGTAIGGQEK